MSSLSISGLTTIHVVVSLIAIAAGIVWLTALLQGRWSKPWNTLFLSLTVVTTITGFIFPVNGITPALVVGIISTMDLLLATVALVIFKRQGLWRAVYAATATLALYLNSFVAVVQAFQKIPALNWLAPTGTEPTFVVSQVILLLGFAFAGFLALRRSERDKAHGLLA